MTLVDIVLWLVPLALGVAVGWAFTKFKDTLKKVKAIYEGEPIWSILAGAAVMVSEAVWSEYGGEAQFHKACEMLSVWAGGALFPDQVEIIIQRAYETVKELLGEYWDELKIDLAEEVGTSTMGEVEGME
jgi:hypothetical protein